MRKIRKGDLVQVIKGRDKGKKGKVLNLFLEKNLALVEGVNLVKKHKRRTREDQQGGIVSIEVPMNIANLMFFCKQCNHAARIGIMLLKDGTKTRFCKNCKEAVG